MVCEPYDRLTIQNGSVSATRVARKLHRKMNNSHLLDVTENMGIVNYWKLANLLLYQTYAVDNLHELGHGNWESPFSNNLVRCFSHSYNYEMQYSMNSNTWYFLLQEMVAGVMPRSTTRGNNNYNTYNYVTARESSQASNVKKNTL